jgi:TRAP-type C4-dicarboxylate transport system substrate-binding protein
MNEGSFQRLPEDIRTALEEEVFGEPISREIGKIWDAGDQNSVELTKETEGNTITTASEADQEKFDEISASIINSVIEEVGETGVDAQAAYDMLSSELSED